MDTHRRRLFGKLEIDPALSPAVLDTATWDRDAAWQALQAIEENRWHNLSTAAAAGAELPLIDGLQLYTSACTWHENTLVCLAGLADGQRVVLAIGPQAATVGLAEPIRVKPLAAPAAMLACYPADAPVIDRFCRSFVPDKGPRAIGPVPRLGIGTRMTTAVWPAIWKAMAQRRFAANAIQNSVRELNFMATLLEGRPADKNIAFGFGAIETGYTGSSFEGLWLAGVLSALEHGVAQPYGADADHIQVKRGADGIAHARRLLDATRYYSFYTLDVSDVLDYAALTAAHNSPLEETIPNPVQRRELLAWHRQPRRIGGVDYRPDEATLARLARKYWQAMDAVTIMHDHICSLKAGVPFDLELSIDEHPNEVPTFDCLTGETELLFVLLEAQRRNLPLTHVAPNFGVEKGTDYRGDDGLPGFEARARTLCRLTSEFGIMADFHSGDDLSAATRQAIGRATAGHNHFKVSPNLQLLFAGVLADHHPDLFRRWWQDSFAYAQREAASGSRIALDCLRQADAAKPSAHDAIFHHFSFAFVGRRDTNGQFICREEFYGLSAAFHRDYQACIQAYLLELADDLQY